jgi:hypothetical protein
MMQANQGPWGRGQNERCVLSPTEVYRDYRALFLAASSKGRTAETVSQYFAAALAWCRLRRKLPAEVLSALEVNP